MDNVGKAPGEGDGGGVVVAADGLKGWLVGGCCISVEVINVFAINNLSHNKCE